MGTIFVVWKCCDCVIGYFDSNYRGDQRIMRTAKDRARAHIAYRLRIGAIRKPPVCHICNLPGLLEAHHPDYGQPDNVIWVHRACHAALRRRAKIQAVAMCAAIAVAAVAAGGCAAFSDWMQQQEEAGVDVPGAISDTVGTWSFAIPSPWREIVIGAAGIVGIALQAFSKRKLRNQLSGK